MLPATRALPPLQREPATIPAGVQSLLVLLVTLGVPISEWWQTLILTVTGTAAAAYTAWRVSPTWPAALVAIVQLAMPAAVLVGLPLTEAGQTALLTTLTLVLGWLTRTQVSPSAARPRPRPLR